MSIHQQAMIPASPEQVYAVLADADALSGLSGLRGKAGRSAGLRLRNSPPSTAT